MVLIIGIGVLLVTLLASTCGQGGAWLPRPLAG